MTVRAIRGATTLERDERTHLYERTQELVAAMLAQNALTPDDLVSVFFTATPDIVSDFPAAPARMLGLDAVPLMCAQEIAVEGAMPLVVRAMAHANLERPREEIVHVYLHGAVALRRDLSS